MKIVLEITNCTDCPLCQYIDDPCDGNYYWCRLSHNKICEDKPLSILVLSCKDNKPDFCPAVD